MTPSPPVVRVSQVVADEESGTNVEQVAANTAAIIQANPDLTGMVGFDSEAGPGIVRAVTESGKAGQIIVTSNEAGREFMNSIKDGTVKMINMEKYETMDFFGSSISTRSTTTSSATSTWITGSRTRCRPSGTRA